MNKAFYTTEKNKLLRKDDFTLESAYILFIALFYLAIVLTLAITFPNVIYIIAEVVVGVILFFLTLKYKDYCLTKCKFMIYDRYITVKNFRLLWQKEESIRFDLINAVSIEKIFGINVLVIEFTTGEIFSVSKTKKVRIFHLLGADAVYVAVKTYIESSRSERDAYLEVHNPIEQVAVNTK